MKHTDTPIDHTTLPSHDGRRCQACDGMGELVSLEASGGGKMSPAGDDEYVKDSGDWHRVDHRVLECRECGLRWANYS